MDYCKNKQFIAFINKNSRDRYWCDGYFAWDEYAPTLHPYDTKEQKRIAHEIGEAIAAFSETNDIEAVILTVNPEVISIVNKDNKSDALARFEKRSVENIKKQEELKKKALEEKRKKPNEDNVDLGDETTNIQNVPLVEQPVVQPAEKQTSSKNNEKILNENTNDVGRRTGRNSSVQNVPSGDKKNTENKPVVNKSPTKEVLTVEKKRSPLEKRIPQQKEMVKKEQPAPTEPKKKSGLSKIMKGK